MWLYWRSHDRGSYRERVRSGLRRQQCPFFPRILEGVEKITGTKIKNYKVDLCNYDDTFAIFQENENIAGIIHFAAYKAVGESVEQPLMYFENNLLSLINLLKCVQEFEIPHFVFSSSCTVYGNPDTIP